MFKHRFKVCLPFSWFHQCILLFVVFDYVSAQVEPKNVWRQQCYKHWRLVARNKISNGWKNSEHRKTNVCDMSVGRDLWLKFLYESMQCYIAIKVISAVLCSIKHLYFGKSLNGRSMQMENKWEVFCCIGFTLQCIATLTLVILHSCLAVVILYLKIMSWAIWFSELNMLYNVWWFQVSS